MNEKIKKSIKGFWYDPKGTAKLAVLYAAPLFWIILALKLCAGSLFASDFLSNLFIPFLEQFAAHPTQDPYAAFLEAGQANAFPYPAFMLYIMGLPRLLLGAVLDVEVYPYLQLFIYRLPLLLADIAIIAILVRWSRDKVHNLLWLYWASPVLFYISYLHGQLDIIPIALLFLALYWLFKERLILAALTLGLGLATKTHLVIAVPFFLIYAWRQKESLRPLISFTGVMALAFITPNIPFWDSAAFQEMVFFNSTQKQLTVASLSFAQGASFYLILGAYLLLLFKALQITVQNRDLFLMFLGFSFSALLLFVVPMPGWYFWILPFLAYFFAKAKGHQALMLWGLQAAYFFYFFSTKGADYLNIFQFVSPEFSQGTTLFAFLQNNGIDPTVLVNCTYTTLQTTLLIICAWVYRRGVRSYQKHKLTSRSFLIGISGDSGSGKTTLAATLSALFTPRNVTVVCGDDMHKWQRGHQKWGEMTHLDPRANELHHELQYITALRMRRTVHRRHYDHNTGQFTEALPIKPRPLVVFEGLHSFYLKSTRSMMDLKIFIKPDEELLLHRKVMRDTEKRGHSKDKVMESIAHRKDDAKKYIEIQERNADITVSYKLKAPLNTAVGDKNVEPELTLCITAPNSYYFDPLIADLGSVLEDKLSHTYEEDDRQTIAFDAPVQREVIEALGEKHITGLQDLAIYDPEWQDGFDGILQLFLAWCIFTRSKEA